MGLPASGKSTALAEPLVKTHGALLVDSDIAKRMLPEYGKGEGAPQLRKESSSINGAVYRKALMNGDNIVFPTLGADINVLNKSIDMAKAKGYDVHVHHLEISPEESAKRAVTRFKKGGQFIDPNYIIHRVGLQPAINSASLKDDERLTSHTHYDGAGKKGTAPAILNSRENSTKGLDKTGGESVSATHGGKSDVRVNGTANPIRKGTGTSSREDRANQGEVDGRANRSGVLEAEKESVTKPRIEAAAKEIVPEDKSLILTSEDAKKDTPLKINGEEVKRPDVLVSKSELKDLINTLPDKQGDFKVVLNPEGQMRMNLTTPTGTMSLRPSALGLVESQLREGDVIHVDADNLKPKGTSYRVMNKDNKVEASGGGSPSTTRMVKPTFSNEMNRGFVNPGEVIKQASDYLEKTSSNAAAAKNLDDEVYNVGKNVEADAIETNKLLKEFRKIPKEDVRMIDIYRDELEAGLTPPALTPEQQRLNDEVINPLLKDAASKAAYIRAKGVDVDIAPPMDHETYNPRMTKDKGGVIDAAIRTKDKLLNKSGAGKRNILSQSAPSLKPRVHGALTYENGQRVTTSHVDGHILQHNVDGTTTDLGPTKQKVSTKVKEFYDPEVRGKLEQLAKDLGIKHERHATGRTTGLGGKRAGVSFTGESLIKTRLGPDSVLAHELGHQIDEKYGLQAFMSEERFDAQHKTELAREMRALADERFAGAETTKGFKAYVRKGSEKMAVMFEAYISNEQLFKDVAPHLYDDFRQFLSDHAELRPFLDIKGSVQLSSMTHGGEYLGGKKGDTFIDKFGKKWTIGEATKAEIERVTTTRYYHNPFLAAALIHENITQVYRAVKMLEDYKKSPEFANVAMEKGTGTPPDNWKLGPIDQFRNYFVEPDTWKVMNAYKNELESGNDPIRPLTMINNFMLHTMFLAPVKHGLNVAVTAFAHRGMTRWMNPLAYPTLARTSIKAIMDVLRQNDDFLTTLRDGASFMSAKKDYQGRQDDILALVGEETDATKKAYQLAKKTIGAVTPFNWVHAMVWPMTDIFMHQAILEGLARQGLTVKTSTSAQRMAIIRNVGKTIPTYRQSVTMRQAPSWVRRNALVFMSWRESMYRNMYGIGREIITGEDLANPRTFTQDSNGKYRHSYFDKESWKTRGSAFNTAISIGFLSLLVWPYLKDEWQKLSKNANASIFMPSFLGVIDNANKFASGKIDIGQYIETLVDMPPFSRESLQQIINTDIFTHQAIRDNTTTAGEQFNQSIQHFEKSATVLDQYNRVNSGALSGKQLIESQFGLNDPDAVQTKLVAAVQTAQTRVDKLDTTTVETVRAIYDQAKAAGFGTPEADALVSPLDAADYKIYQDLKTIDQAKETVALSAKIQPIVNEAYQLGFGTPEADALVANLSDPEMTAYHAIKTILYGAKGTGQPNFTPGTTTNDTSIIGSVLAYANAIRTDPLTAFERIFTGQRILRTENGTIIVERNSPLEARVKAQLGGTTEMTLDHLKSFELGGDNSSGNMWLVPKAQAAIDDKVENMLGAALSAGKIDGKQAQEYELRYKKGADAAEIDARTKSTFDSVGAPLTLDQITELLK
jgi:predicted ABC-type ATPase